MNDLGPLADEQFLYLTTNGRRTGSPHEIEIWFGTDRRTVYMLAGGREESDWVRNIMTRADVTVRIGGRTFAGTGRIVSDTEEDAMARRLLLEKYEPTYSGDLKEWGETALPVAVELGDEIA
jgi:deazaflavin-dependent oxidoreductase (nitroreductase family)